MKLINIFTFITCTIFISSCTKDVGLNPDLIIKEIGACDTVTFTKHIKPIIDNNCTSCHSPLGGQSPDLTTYDLLKSQVDAGRIKARVIDQNPSVMPQGGALPANEINLIKCWLDAGAPNN